jgi:hypothetical protein
MKALYVTYCSGKKNPVKEGTPKQLYDSKRIMDFIKICESKGHDYAILSAKYGLFFPNEVRKNYNVTFKSVAYDCRIVEDEVLLSKDESHRHLLSLVQQIRKRILENNIERVVFYCIPPLKRRKCYLKVLHVSADNCQINHKRWDELVNHIKSMFIEGRGKIKIIQNLADL